MKVGELFKHVHYLHAHNVNLRLKKHDMTLSQMNVLICIAKSTLENKEINQRNIEKALRLTNPTVTGLINRLEQKGYIERVPSYKDKRIKYLVLTEEGKKINEEIKLIFESSDNTALKGFSDQEKQELKNYLLRIFYNLKEGEEIDD